MNRNLKASAGGHARRSAFHEQDLIDAGGMPRSVWWDALYSRDQRFDGRFFIGAATTRIYCRPICPVPFARPNNLVWFACAAAAEAAGYRACRRCRPETSPGTPAWGGTSAVVSRALRLISEGVLDKGTVDDLAGRLGVGSRQLRRLFLEHLGAPPIKVAITHRVHFACNLIKETTLPITEIALSSGFTSIRQFNHAVRGISGQSPTDLRHAQQHELTRSSEGRLHIRLRYRPPFDWPALIAFLKARAIPGIEEVHDDSYRRTISMGSIAGSIDVRPDQDEPFLSVRIELPGCQNLISIAERIRRIFDLGADPRRINEDLSHDPWLKPLIDRRPGLRVPGAWDGFELAVRAVLGEQITTAGSTSLFTRIVQTFGKPVKSSIPGLTHLFPTAEQLAAADLSKAGLRGHRGRILKSLAYAARDGQLTFSGFMNLDRAIEGLGAVRGISQDTAHYIAMRALGEPDAFPINTVRNAISRENRISVVKLRPMSQAWRPWRAYAALHLCFAHTDSARR